MDKVIDRIEFPISTGKEANVFRARTNLGGFLAVKIYRVDNATFRNISTYITGDPRFMHIAGKRKHLIEAWASKEYKNLIRLENAGIRVPKAVAQLENVLVMEYIGNENEPAPLLKDYEIKNPSNLYDTILEYMKKMYNNAELVHSDLSEYNILMNRGKPVIIDVAQAVTLRHPMAWEFLERDATNIAKFFVKKGIKTSKEDILNYMGAKR
ncbi:MAG: serine protein kinase RIO [Thermoplasmata archaeon]